MLQGQRSGLVNEIQQLNDLLQKSASKDQSVRGTATVTCNVFCACVVPYLWCGSV
jgi:hypothetical protein